MTLGNQMVAGFVCSSLQTIQFLLTLMVVIVKVNLGKKRPDLGNVSQPHCLCLCFLFCPLKIRVLRLNLTLETYLQIGKIHCNFNVIQLHLYYSKGICFQLSMWSMWILMLYDRCRYWMEHKLDFRCRTFYSNHMLPWPLFKSYLSNKTNFQNHFIVDGKKTA